MTTTEPQHVGGHRLVRAATRQADGWQWTCVDCQATGPYGLFNVIGQRDFCPERVDSMNGYIWFNAADPDHQAERAARQWESYARRCGFAIHDFHEITDEPGICATFLWRSQRYVVRYGADTERGMNPSDLRVELAPATLEASHG